MRAGKKLTIAIIERERELYRIMTGLEAVGLTIKAFGARSDLVLQALGVEPDEDGFFSDWHSDPFWEGLESGHSADEIYVEMIKQVAVVAS